MSSQALTFPECSLTCPRVSELEGQIEELEEDNEELKERLALKDEKIERLWKKVRIMSDC